MLKNGKHKILVIDDDQGARDALEMLLSQQYEVLLTDTCKEGFEIAVEQKPDLIILDLGFPGGESGFKTCKKLKEDERTNDIPIIILTGEGITTEEESRGIEIGADDYIIRSRKNLNIVIETRIKKVLERNKQKKEYSSTISIDNINLA